MKPERAGVVSRRPSVCSAKPAHNKIPIQTALAHAALLAVIAYVLFRPAASAYFLNTKTRRVG